MIEDGGLLGAVGVGVGAWVGVEVGDSVLPETFSVGVVGAAGVGEEVLLAVDGAVVSEKAVLLGFLDGSEAGTGFGVVVLQRPWHALVVELVLVVPGRSGRPLGSGVSVMVPVVSVVLVAEVPVVLVPVVTVVLVGIGVVTVVGVSFVVVPVVVAPVVVVPVVVVWAVVGRPCGSPGIPASAGPDAVGAALLGPVVPAARLLVAPVVIGVRTTVAGAGVGVAGCDEVSVGVVLVGAGVEVVVAGVEAAGCDVVSVRVVAGLAGAAGAGVPAEAGALAGAAVLACAGLWWALV